MLDPWLLGRRRETDLVGALMLTVGTGRRHRGVRDRPSPKAPSSPERRLVPPRAALAAAAFVVHLVRAVRRSSLARRPRRRPGLGRAGGDVLRRSGPHRGARRHPVLRPPDRHRDSQLDAALVLLRFLIALPVGAVLGGWLLRRVPAHVLTAVGDAAQRGRVRAHGHWDARVAEAPSETFSLVLGGLGFGLAHRSGQRRLLEHTEGTVHGVASALLIVARMVGMLLGISALTTIGLHAFYDAPRDPDLGLAELATVQEQSVSPARPSASACSTRCSRCAVPAAAPPSVLCDTAGGPPDPRIGFRAMADFDDLLAANREFAEHFTFSGFDGVAHAGVAMVTCMDSRIDPLGMIGLSPGDAKILRNPGGRVTDQALVALVLGVNLLEGRPHPRGRAHPLRMARRSEDELRARSEPAPAWTRPGCRSASSTTRRPPIGRT